MAADQAVCKGTQIIARRRCARLPIRTDHCRIPRKPAPGISHAGHLATPTVPGPYSYATLRSNARADVTSRPSFPSAAARHSPPRLPVTPERSLYERSRSTSGMTDEPDATATQDVQEQRTRSAFIGGAAGGRPPRQRICAPPPPHPWSPPARKKTALRAQRSAGTGTRVLCVSHAVGNQGALI